MQFYQFCGSVGLGNCWVLQRMCFKNSKVKLKIFLKEKVTFTKTIKFIIKNWWKDNLRRRRLSIITIYALGIIGDRIIDNNKRKIFYGLL